MKSAIVYFLTFLFIGFAALTAHAKSLPREIHFTFTNFSALQKQFPESHQITPWYCIKDHKGNLRVYEIQDDVRIKHTLLRKQNYNIKLIKVFTCKYCCTPGKLHIIVTSVDKMAEKVCTLPNTNATRFTVALNRCVDA